MRWSRAGALALALIAAGCATTPRRPVAAVPGVKIGKPYEVFGVRYVPADDRDYDATGIASWYGPGFHALATANGERYDQDALTAAHKTLPLPSWVEVSNLDNGRVLTVRLNDRGPFVAGRIIDLSRRSAQLLGVDTAGLARVRVRRVYPDGAALAAAASPVAMPAAPVPLATIAAPSVAAAGTTYIQVAALADAGRAAWLAGWLGSYGAARIERSPAGLHRVRLGPYADAAAAAETLARVRAAGYSDAAVVAAP